MTQLTITLPDELQQFVDQQVARGDHATASDYVRELIHQAQKQHAEQERLEALLLEGLTSPASEMTAADWKEIEREGMERLAARKSA